MNLWLGAVCLPLLLMGGLVGRLFREFVVAVSVAILMSGVISLTLTPMMCGWLLRAPAEGEREWPVVVFLDRVFQRSLDFYGLCLRAVLRHLVIVLAVMAAT